MLGQGIEEMYELDHTSMNTFVKGRTVRYM